MISFFTKLILVSAFSSMILSCTKDVNTSTPSTTPTSGKSFLALGDSYTIGHNVSAQERFPLYTVQELKQLGIEASEPRYIAVTGWTTLDLQAEIERENPTPNFDIVTLLIGVNDQYQHRDTAAYRTGFIKNLQTAIRLAGNRSQHVFVLSIPDYSATPFVAASDKSRVSSEIDQFNSINRQVSTMYGVNYTDITTLSRAASTDISLLANDGLHYSGKEHQLWAKALAPTIKSAIQ